MGISKAKQYKIGGEFTANFDTFWPFDKPRPGYNVGDRIIIYENKTPVASFRVESYDKDSVTGKIITTYGHKRKNNKSA